MSDEHDDRADGRDDDVTGEPPPDDAQGDDDVTGERPPDGADGNDDPGDEAYGDLDDDYDDLDDDYDEDGLEGYDDLDDFDEFDDAGLPLDAHESAMVEQDLVDLENFEATFRAEGYKGVAVYCHDCAEDHYYPWDMLRENLHLLLETGETPVHEPAFEPKPQEYVPWEYARGYVDALQDVGVNLRREVHRCTRCGFDVPPELVQANFCPRCGTALLTHRLVAALEGQDLDDEQISTVLREIGLPG